jgi:hypothetical protein
MSAENNKKNLRWIEEFKHGIKYLESELERVEGYHDGEDLKKSEVALGEIPMREVDRWRSNGGDVMWGGLRWRERLGKGEGFRSKREGTLWVRFGGGGERIVEAERNGWVWRLKSHVGWYSKGQ